MYLNLMQLKDHSVRAEDGEIGRVKGFYFDDLQWAVRYFLVETRWEEKREVIIAPEALTSHDLEKKDLATSLKLVMVKDSPPIDTAATLPIPQEEKIAHYYDWPDYWSSIAVESGKMSRTERNEGTKIYDRMSVSHNLRRLDGILGFSVQSYDGVVGIVDGFIADDQDWQVEFIVVRSEDRAKHVLVSPDWLEVAFWDDKSLSLTVSAGDILSGPACDPVHPPDAEFLEKFYRHFGITPVPAESIKY